MTFVLDRRESEDTTGPRDPDEDLCVVWEDRYLHVDIPRLRESCVMNLLIEFEAHSKPMRGIKVSPKA